MGFENLSPGIFITFNMLICVFMYIVISSIETTIEGQDQVSLSYPVPEVYPCRQKDGHSAEKHSS